MVSEPDPLNANQPDAIQPDAIQRDAQQRDADRLETNLPTATPSEIGTLALVRPDGENVTLRGDLARIMATGGIKDLPDKLMCCYYVLCVSASAYLISSFPRLVEQMNAPGGQSIAAFFRNFEREREFMGDVRWVRQTGRSSRPILCLGMLFFPAIVLVWMTKYYLTELFRSPFSSSLTKPTDGELILRQEPVDRKEPAAFFFSSAFPIAALTLVATGVPAAICLLLYNGLGIDALLGFPSLNPNFAKVIIIQFYFTSLCWCLSVLFFRSWFTFPLNFMSTEYDIAIYPDAIFQRPIKGWFMAILTTNCNAAVVRWDEVTSVKLEGDTDFTISTKITEVSVHPKLQKFIQSTKKWLNLHESIAALSKRRMTRLNVISPGSTISICLDDLSQNDKMQLHYCIRNYAPSIHLPGPIQEALVGTKILNDPRYTEIWFALMHKQPLQMADNEIVPGKLLHNDKYEVIEKLKAGGEAVTYLARTQDGQKVVLKRFQLAVGDSITSLVQSAASFENESALLSQFDCAGIVKLQEFFLSGNSAYLCIEHVDGATLRETVSKGGPLSEEKVAKIATQLCLVLEYLHGLTPPVVHRDFTPENIILLPDGSVKVIDFSVAQQRHDSKNTDCAGKHSYTPPEQFRGQACPGSDIYALGGVVYFLLTGKDPTPLKQVKVSGDDIVPLKKFEKILANATALDVAERYSSADWMKTELVALTKASGSAP